MTAAQRAMATAMIYPELEKVGAAPQGVRVPPWRSGLQAPGPPLSGRKVESIGWRQPIGGMGYSL